MATIVDSGFPNLQNIMAGMGPDGALMKTVEIMTVENPILEDLPWMEGNSPGGHRIFLRDQLPAPAFRAFNKGALRGKAEGVPYDETCGLLEQWAEVDADEANLNGNSAAWMWGQQKGFIQGFARAIATSLFYDNVANNPLAPHGLAARYPSTSGYVTSPYVQKVGAISGANCHSIWVLSLDEDNFTGIYPKGSKAGLQVEDQGKVRITDSLGNPFHVFSTKYAQKFGWLLADHRRCMRIQWSPTVSLDANKDLYLALQAALDTVYSVGAKTIICMDRLSKQKVNAQLLSNESRPLDYLSKNGKTIPHFMGIPIRITDALVAETAVT